MNTKPWNLNLNLLDEEAKVLPFPVKAGDLFRSKGFVEDLVIDATREQILPNVVSLHVTVSQSVSNIMDVVEAIKLWKKSPLLDWYRKSGHGWRNSSLGISYFLITEGS